MTSHSDDLDPLRRELEGRRAWDEYEKEQLRAQQEAERYFKRAEFMERWFRRIGMPTRILVYLIGLILLWVLSYGFIDTKDFSDRPLGSLTLRELWNNLLPVLIASGGTVMLIRGFFAEADGGLDDGVDWDVWGKAGLWLLPIAALIAFSLIG